MGAHGEVLLAGLDRVDAILVWCFRLAVHHGVVRIIATRATGLGLGEIRDTVSCFMYRSPGIDTGPVHDMLAYLYQLALGSISCPQLIGMQVRGERRGLAGALLDLNRGGEGQIEYRCTLSASVHHC